MQKDKHIWYKNALEKISKIESNGYLYANHPETFREDICWCGSFRKYKDCHLKHSEYKPLTYEEYWKICKRHYSRKGKCLFEDCDEKSINSHSVPSRWLISIANKLKCVYQFQYDIFESLVKNNPNPIKTDAISVIKSSTFRGFCSKHDAELFKDLENKPSWEVNSRNILLLYYRSICYELFRKYTARDLSVELRSKCTYGKDLFQQVGQFQHFSQHLYGVEKAIEDLEELKGLCENRIKEECYSSLSYTYIPLKQPCKIMAAGIHHPIATFKGNALQEISEDSLINVSCILGQNGKNGFVLFVDFGVGDSRSRLFHQDLLKCRFLEKRIMMYLFETTENLFWEMDGWDKLSKYVKQKILALMKDTVLEDSFQYCSEDIKTYNKMPVVDSENITQIGV